MLWKPTRRQIIRAGGLIAAPAIIGMAQAQAQVPMTGAGRGAPGGAAFTPASLTNLIGWWKADIGVTTSSGNITAVADQSGNGNNLAVGGSGVVPFNATSAYNSKPAFDFQGAVQSSGLATGSSNTGATTLPVTNRFTAWGIGQMLSGTDNFGGYMSIGQSASSDFSTPNNIALITRQSTSSAIETFYNSGAITVDTSMSTGANHRWIVTYDGTTLQHYVDGVAGSSAAGSISLVSPTNIVIGARWGGGFVGLAMWLGPICEAGIAMSFANSTTVAQLDGYLTGKWGS